MDVCGIPFTTVDPSNKKDAIEVSIYNNAPQQYMILPNCLEITGKYEKALETNFIGIYDFQTIRMRAETKNSPKKRVFIKEFTRPTEVQTINNILTLQPYGCVVPSYGVCSINGKVCLISQLVEHNINSYLKSHPGLPLLAKLRICKQMAKKLLIIQDNGLIHGNICPSNVLVTDGGSVFYTDVRNGPPDLENLTACSDDTLKYMYVKLQSMEYSPTVVTDRYSLCLLILKVLKGKLPFSDAPALAFPNMMSKLTSEELSKDILNTPAIPELMREIMGRLILCDGTATIEELKAAIDETILLELGKVAGTHAGITMREAEARIIKTEQTVEDCADSLSREVERLDTENAGQRTLLEQFKGELEGHKAAQESQNERCQKLIEEKDDEHKTLLGSLKTEVFGIAQSIEQLGEANNSNTNELREAIKLLATKIDSKTEEFENELKQLREELDNNKREQSERYERFESRVEELVATVQDMEKSHQTQMEKLKEDEELRLDEQSKELGEAKTEFDGRMTAIEADLALVKEKMTKSEKSQRNMKEQLELDQAIITEIKFQNFSMIDTISYLKSKIEKHQPSSL